MVRIHDVIPYHAPKGGVVRIVEWCTVPSRRRKYTPFVVSVGDGAFTSTHGGSWSRYFVLADFISQTPSGSEKQLRTVPPALRQCSARKSIGVPEAKYARVRRSHEKFDEHTATCWAEGKSRFIAPVNAAALVFSENHVSAYKGPSSRTISYKTRAWY